VIPEEVYRHYGLGPDCDGGHRPAPLSKVRKRNVLVGYWVNLESKSAPIPRAAVIPSSSRWPMVRSLKKVIPAVLTLPHFIGRRSHVERNFQERWSTFTDGLTHP